MMVSESYERECLLLDKQTIDVAVEAKMLKDTQFAYLITLIIWHLNEGNYKTSIEFNPFTTIRPVVGTIVYFKIVESELRKRLLEKPDSGTSFWGHKQNTSSDGKPKKSKVDETSDMEANSESSEELLPKKPNT